MWIELALIALLAGLVVRAVVGAYARGAAAQAEAPPAGASDDAQPPPPSAAGSVQEQPGPGP